ncbi:hypothetical protein PILCRDRAFT_824554 [Piloderma croceum F 1598]|uniref:Peptidase C14 caspase domain-containing protein n=1 Tax=Piloderma croceum (strain F 1598) TaxID=765440 RepID=A0A0C3BLZ6_PILCF|nr:hypothetical protein PILCRDRAFT_824554 [Piloderma croceum F 1598]
MPLPKKKKGGVVDMVDRLIVRVIAPQMKRQHEPYSDHDDRHSDNQSYDQHSEDHDRDSRRDDRSLEYQPSIHEYSAHEGGDDEVAERGHYSNQPPLVIRSIDQSLAQHHPRNPSQGQSRGYATTRSIDQSPAQHHPRNPSQGHSQGYAVTRSIDQSPAQHHPRNPSHGQSQGHAGVHPSNTKRTATSPRGLKRLFPIHEPPISPIQIFCHDDSGNTQSSCRHPTFQYSNCSGKKKAVCVGINYIGQKRELHGCIDDAHDISNFLIRKYHYKPEDVLVLTDDLHDERQRPTRANMINAMQWLIKDAKRHDSLFFHYSGHGGQTNGTDVDPEKGYDDVIFPVDYQRAGYIADRELNKYLVHPLPQGCRLTSLFDSCHSGTVLDLPYIYHSNGRLAGRNISEHWRASKASSADAISWCACRDDQSSADTQEHGEAVGAMSWAFRTALTRNPNQSYAQLLKSVREILRNRYSQVSQLSSSHPMDHNVRFLM